MDKDIQELLKPRYKVIADYPDSVFIVGEILRNPTYESKYPHLFKKLEWWEDRKPEEMPKYLKHTYDGKTSYYKIIKWDMEFMVAYMTETQVCNLRLWKPEFSYYPSTEEEFNNQNK